MWEQLNHFFFKKVSSIGLALFRVAYSFVFLFEVLKIFNYRHLYFDKLPYLTPHFPDSTLMFFLWIGILIFLILGWYTRMMAILNYVLTLVFVSSAINYEYHMFYVYTGMNFLFLFLPISKTLSVDLVRKKLKYIDQGMLYTPPKVSKMNYFLPVFVGLALVYFDSAIFYKMKSPMWLEGLGLWLPSSLPHITISNNQWLLNQEFLVRSLSYITMAFEFLFIFLFWHKKFRIPLVIIGIGLHIGIFIEYPIPYFAWGCLSIYILLVPIALWGKIWQKIGHKKEKLSLYYNDSGVSAHRFKAVVEFLDIFKRIRFRGFEANAQRELIAPPATIPKGALYVQKTTGDAYTGAYLFHKIAEEAPLCYVLLGLHKINLFRSLIPEDFVTYSKPKVFSQFSINEDQTYQRRSKLRNGLVVSFLLLSILFQTQVNYSFFGDNSTTYKVNHALVRYLGICDHPVFMDFHFKGYTNLFGLKYNNKFLPILDENGMPDDYLCGGTWVNFMWRVNMPYGKENSFSLRKGFANYSSFWAHQNEINLRENQEFEIVRKEIEVPFKWKKDLLKTNIEGSWENVGKLVWKDNKTHFFWDTK